MIKILFLAANPLDKTRIGLDHEIRAIDRALRQASFRDVFEIQQHWAVRVSDLQSLLLRHKPNIVHLSGHGSPLSEIILEDDRGNSQPVSQEALAGLFAVLSDSVRCVVLNACYSEQQAIGIGEHIDCVIGMPEEIGDQASIGFSSAFYQALGYGKTIGEAFALGRNFLDLLNEDPSKRPTLIATRIDDPWDIVLFPVDYANLDLVSAKIAQGGSMKSRSDLALLFTELRSKSEGEAEKLARQLAVGYLRFARFSERSERLFIPSNYRVSVGRYNDNDIIMDYDDFVSSHHAIFEATESEVFVRDLNSTNGTRRNGNRVRGLELLQNGDTIEIGRTSFEFFKI